MSTVQNIPAIRKILNMMAQLFCRRSCWQAWIVVLSFTCFFSMVPQNQGRAYPGVPSVSLQSQKEIDQAFKLIRQGRWDQAAQKIANSRNMLATKLYYWLSYQNGQGQASFSRISSFIKRHSDWPGQRDLRRAAERALEKEDVHADVVLAWFEEYPPLTPEGMKAYMRVLTKARQYDKAREILNKWWGETLLSTNDQEYFLKYYGRLIGEDAQVIRLGLLLFNGYYTNARMVAHLLGHGYPALAEARIRLAEEQIGVDAALQNVPAHLQNDPGLMYERLRWRRRHNKTYGVLEILHEMPDIERIPNPQDWWRERHIMTRRFIEQERYKDAYMLVSAHKQKEGVGFAEAEFLAGWLALRYLDQPWRAFEHFEALYINSSMPISKARGAYWSGRASDALGYTEIAAQWYKVSAYFQTTFYGQLATGALDNSNKPPKARNPIRTPAGLAAFNDSELIQAASLLGRAGFDDEMTDFIFAHIEKNNKSPEQYLLAAEMAEHSRYDHIALLIAKKASYRGIVLMDYLYPTLLTHMPKGRGVAGDAQENVEWALIHALIRQESAFKQTALSPAGARGLMQLMPATAREVAGKTGYRYSRQRLTSDASFNIALGSSYIGQMLDRYDGSYPLAIAAYNAGPGRVSSWLKEFGDPRKGEIDIIDWTERIPVPETRNYVQRVLENVYIYRQKLDGVQKSAHSSFRQAKAD